MSTYILNYPGKKMTGLGTVNELVFFCNGRKVIDKNVDPETTLLSYLRRKLRLTGSKLGCSEGGCGACTVMVSSYDHTKDSIRHVAVNACLAPICSVHGTAVTTIEGIGSTKTKLHPVQERLAASHGSQCGFCTPGIVMSMYTLLRNNQEPSMQDIFGAFEGNLCRCTGYRPILEGYRTFTKGCGKQNCCQNGEIQNGVNGVRLNGVGEQETGGQNGQTGHEANGTDIEEVKAELFRSEDFGRYDPSQEPIFPPELMIDNQKLQSSLKFCGPRVTWFRPATLDELLKLRAQYLNSKLVVGNTEIGVEVKFKNQLYPVLIDASHIKEMQTTSVNEDGVFVGASLNLSDFKKFLEGVIEEKSDCQVRSYTAITEMLRWFAGPQIRNVASIGGNIATGSPISDLNPLFMACKSTLTLASVKGTRTVEMNPDFFLSYRKTAMLHEEVIVSVFIPFTSREEFMFGYKQSPRKEDDIAIVNAGMKVRFLKGTNLVEDIQLAFGGMAPTTILAVKTMNKLREMIWNHHLLEEATTCLQEELSLPDGVPGGMEVYRQSLVLSFFFKFYLKVLKELGNDPDLNTAIESIPSTYESAVTDSQPKEFCSTQVFQEVPDGQPLNDAVGRPIPHLSAKQQVTGEAKYIDDLPKLEGELYLAFVFSHKAHAKIISLDVSAALALPGVEDVITAGDVPGSNSTGVYSDEELFAVDKVVCVGQIIAVVVAENQSVAQRAAKLVNINYEELEPILTIQEAINEESFLQPTRTISVGNLTQGFEESDHVLEGECHIGAQEHFYLETMASILIPKEEHSEMEIISSTQNVTETQLFAALALGVPLHKIVCRTKRLGGGFGGKETRCSIYSAAAAVAANKVDKPVRYMLDRDEDMMSTGTRHPFLGRYKVGFTKEGKILALDISLYANSGHCKDLSASVVERGIFHCDNTYNIHNLRVTGYVCKTNLPSCTAFRGFGAPQSMWITESWMTDVAMKLGLPQEQVREVNFYKEGELSHFKQRMTGWNLNRCWESCMRKSCYGDRRKDVDEFNRQNRWRKRGLAVTPTKFGISFTAKFLNQAGALVHIYKDGSVLVTHGGIEMGQGLHTKMIQVASRSLRIPKELIRINETSTDKVPNSSATAASASSDLNGMAVQRACQTLLQRLEKYIAVNPKGDWKDWVNEAYMDRVSLSATGFYKTPLSGYDWDSEEQEGQLFDYFCYGTSVSEVEIDCLTGDHEVLRSDVVMDVGNSINPAVDIGQIEGAFVQGYGLFVLEDYRYSPNGHLLTKGPGFYKIPGFADAPKEFNVSLLDGAPNHRAVCSSKAVGEPPLFLSASIFFAIKDAIASARANEGLTGIFRLDSPACSERIRLACQDEYTKKFAEPVEGTYKPFFIRP